MLARILLIAALLLQVIVPNVGALTFAAAAVPAPCCCEGSACACEGCGCEADTNSEPTPRSPASRPVSPRELSWAPMGADEFSWPSAANSLMRRGPAIVARLRSLPNEVDRTRVCVWLT